MYQKSEKHRSIAIIGSGEMAVIIADEARRMGIVSHSFSSNIIDRVVGHSDQHHNIDIFDLNHLVSMCKNLNVTGIIPTTELTINIAAKVSHELGLIGMPIEVSLMVTDKGYVRDKISVISTLKQPTYYIWNVGEKLPKILHFPVIVKPTSLGGKRGISVAKSDEELLAAIKYCVSNMPP